MNFNIDVTAIRGGFEDLVKEAFKSGNGEFVEVGWFGEQGTHPNTNGEMTYAELAEYHATGGNGTGKVIERPVLHVTSAIHPFSSNKDFHPLISAWLKDPSISNTELMLSKFGKNYVQKIKSVFGSSHLHPTPGNRDPLVDSGALRDHTSHKNSISNTVKMGL